MNTNRATPEIPASSSTALTLLKSICARSV
jgi:hypothetical protein